MKALGNSRNVTVVAMLAIAGLAIAFWMLALSPKREEAAALGKEVKQVEASLAAHRAEVVEAEAARKEFPADYQKLVVLGKAVPGDDDVASLLVQMNDISERARVDFRNIQLSSDGGGGEEAAAPTAAAGGAPVSATEATASLMPLGASVGPAGLAVMPYTLTFDGGFFQVADFIKGLDSLVKTDPEGVVVDGRLLTIDGFSLSADQEIGFPALEASFSVTTYLTPPSEGVTGGATPGSPAGETAAPVATTTGGLP